MTVSPDMRRNLKELTKTINEFNKTIKKLSKMPDELFLIMEDDVLFPSKGAFQYYLSKIS